MQVIRDKTIPIINNRNNFLIKNIPKHHPSSIKYLKYWKHEKRRCIEGYWGIDDSDIDCTPLDEPKESSKWRYMPGKLYFYVNYGTIKHRPDYLPKTAPKIKMKPYLRDFEWAYYYVEIEARGFSGFSEDKKYSCNEFLLNDEYTNEDLVHMCKDQYGKIIDLKYNNFFKENGERKEYVNPREYIRRIFNKPMGLPVYENEASNFMLLGARGGGKSFLTANNIAHEWLFDGAKYYTQESIKNPAVAEILVGAAIASKSSEILGKVSDMIEELPGCYNKETVHPFYKDHAGTLNPNNFKNPYRHEYDKKIAGKWKKLGSKSKIYHATFTVENPEAAAGTRPGLIIVEEVGLAPNILTVHGSNEAAQMTDGVVKFGTSIYIGTGGNVEKIIESELIFRDPKGFSMLAFDDIWEGNGKIGWFVPAYYMDGNYKDENGNTMFEKAISVYEKRRLDKKKSKTTSALDLEMMNYPLKPSEMFINKSGNRFPIADLKQQLVEVQSNKGEYEDKHWIGELIFKKDGTLKFDPEEASKVVRDYPILDNKNKPGTIEIFEMPKRNQDNEIFPNRYYLGTDTYDDDDSTTNSLGCIIVMDAWTKRIVAEYTGRRSTKEFYEVTRKLTLFYNGVNNYENNKKGLFWYYEKKKSLNLLAETPESLRDEANVAIRKSGNTKYGTPATVGVNRYAIQLIEIWLDEQAAGKDEHVSNVQMLRSPGIIKELISYNPAPEYNFDRISALGMLLIIVEDNYKVIDSSRNNDVNKTNLAQDPFFNKNFKSSTSLLDWNNKKIERRNRKINFS